MWSKAGQLDWWVKERQEWWENNGEAGYDIGFLTGFALPGSPTCSRVVATVAVRAAPDTGSCARWAEVILIPP